MARLPAPSTDESNRLSEQLKALQDHCARELGREMAKSLVPGLHIVATPIGNLGDITLRALATLARVDTILCEDTRHSRNLLTHFGIKRRLRPYHEHNASRERPRILEELTGGARLALISDAGTPLISDPGYKLVHDCALAGIPVTALPGPSAALTALVSAGLASDSFFFAGFLPNKQTARRNRLNELAAIPATLIFYEAPSRLKSCLDDIDQMLPGRTVVVARELTKLHEELRRGSASELADWAATSSPKGEMVVLAGPPAITEVSDEAVSVRLTQALMSDSLRDAARIVADELKVAKTRVYNLGLVLKKTGSDE